MSPGEEAGAAGTPNAEDTPLLRRLRERFGEAILSTHCFRGDATATA